jgi:DNA-binding FrmR family transcriptional regulator
VAQDAHCVDILTQVAAVQTALEQGAIELLDAHVRSSLAQATTDGDKQIAELLEAVRHFSKRPRGGPTPPDAD